jgi:hypothetical protein
MHVRNRKMPAFAALAMLAGGAAGLAGGGVASAASTHAPAATKSTTSWDTVLGEYSTKTVATARVSDLTSAGIKGFSVMSTTKGHPTPGTEGTTKTTTNAGGTTGSSGTSGTSGSGSSKTMYVVARKYSSKTAAESELHTIRAKGFIAYAVMASNV